MQKHVTFRNRSSERLAGVLHMPQDWENGFGVILCHGMESSKDSLKHLRLGESLSRLGFAVLRFDFTGAGESSGEFESITYARQVEDLGAAHELLRAHGAAQVGIIGSSMGGTTALLYAGIAERVEAVVTLAAPINLRAILERDFTPKVIAHWRVQGFIEFNGRRLNTDFLDEALSLDVVGAVARIACPGLVIHGDEDSTVPVEQAVLLHDTLRGGKELCILLGADHRFTRQDDRDMALSRAEGWMVRHLRRHAA